MTSDEVDFSTFEPLFEKRQKSGIKKKSSNQKKSLVKVVRNFANYVTFLFILTSDEVDFSTFINGCPKLKTCRTVSKRASIN